MRNTLISVLILVTLAESVYGRQDELPSSTQRAVADRPVDSAAPSQDTMLPPEIVILRKGTHMCLFPGRPISTRTAKRGDKILFHIGTNIDVNGVTLVPQGTEVAGTVTEALRPEIGRKDGKLSFSFGPVPLLGGDTVPIQPAQPIIVAKPQKAKRPVAKTVVEWLDDPYVIFWPLAAPFALLIPFEEGQEKVLFTSNCVPEETSQDVILPKEKVLSARELVAASILPSDAAQVSSAGIATSPAQARGSFQTLAKWPALRARGIAFSPDAVWVSSCSQNSCGVRRLDRASNAIVTTIPTTQAPLAIVATANAVWVTIPEANSVLRIDPSTNKITAKIPTGKSPMGITAGEGAIWVTNGSDKSVSKIDPQINTVTATIRVGTFPDSIVVGDGAVWVANAEGCWGCVGTVSRIDPVRNTVVKTIKTWKYGTEVRPSDLLFQGGNLWAIAAEHILRIDPQTNKIVKWIRIPNKKLFDMPEGMGLEKMHGLAMVDGGLLVADTSQGLLWKVDTHTNSVAHEPTAVGFPMSILGQDEDGSLWISDIGEGSILRVKP